MAKAYTRPENTTMDTGSSLSAPETIEAGRNDADREELERIGVLIESAHTLSEVEVIQERLHAYVCRYPEEKERLADVLEQIFMMHESAREAQLEADAMQLSPDEIQRRDAIFVLRRRVRAEDPPTVFRRALSAARRSLQEWEAIHPEDPQLPYLREVLDNEESVALSLHEMRLLRRAE